MNAVLCEFDTTSYTAPGSVPAFYARVGAPVQKRHCPFCQSLIYSRRHKLCGVCSEELPQQFLFSPEQSESVSSIVRDERQRHRAWLQRYAN